MCWQSLVLIDERIYECVSIKLICACVLCTSPTSKHRKPSMKRKDQLLTKGDLLQTVGSRERSSKQTKVIDAKYYNNGKLMFGHRVTGQRGSVNFYLARNQFPIASLQSLKNLKLRRISDLKTILVGKGQNVPVRKHFSVFGLAM